jgi:hypothetical protein
MSREYSLRPTTAARVEAYKCDMSTIPYPVTVELAGDDEVARWRPFVNWFLAIPHYVVLYFLRIVAQALTFVALLTVLFTRRIPDGVFDFIVSAYRYQWRVTSYAAGLRDEYPPFEFQFSAEDTGTDAGILEIDRPGEMRRFMPLVKWFLAIPHYFILAALAVLSFFAWLIGAVGVLFTGQWNHGIREFIVAVNRYSNRVIAYVGLLTDEYPPFALS